MSPAFQEFFKSVGKTKLLTKEEEVELAKRIEKGDQRARDRMIRANLRLAISIAKKYANKGCALEDLIQESFLGLMKAVDRFDWRKGFKFSTYACWWVKQAVRYHIASQSGSIKLPSYAKSTLWKMQQIKEEYEAEFGVTPSMEEIADMLGSTLPTLKSLMDCSSTAVNLDASAYKNDNSTRSMHEVLVDNSIDDVEKEMDRQKLMSAIKDALKDLTPREEIVLRLRFGISEDEIQEARAKKGFTHANA